MTLTGSDKPNVSHSVGERLQIRPAAGDAESDARLAVLAPFEHVGDADLARVVEAWATLPEAVRRARGGPSRERAGERQGGERRERGAGFRASGGGVAELPATLAATDGEASAPLLRMTLRQAIEHAQHFCNTFHSVADTRFAERWDLECWFESCFPDAAPLSVEADAFENRDPLQMVGIVKERRARSNLAGRKVRVDFQGSPEWLCHRWLELTDAIRRQQWAAVKEVRQHVAECLAELREMASAVETMGDAADNDEATTDEPYRPAEWFRNHTSVTPDRLRQAAAPSRKTKCVASREVDGVKMYCLADVRRWWPGDIEKDERGVKRREPLCITVSGTTLPLPIRRCPPRCGHDRRTYLHYASRTRPAA